MKTVVIIIIMWAYRDGEIRELWRIQNPATLETCLQMNDIFTGGGRVAVSTVRCADWRNIMPPLQPNSSTKGEG